jgi:hypothetical protein
MARLRGDVGDDEDGVPNTPGLPDDPNLNPGPTDITRQTGNCTRSMK